MLEPQCHHLVCKSHQGNVQHQGTKGHQAPLHVHQQSTVDVDKPVQCMTNSPHSKSHSTVPHPRFEPALGPHRPSDHQLGSPMNSPKYDVVPWLIQPHLQQHGRSLMLSGVEVGNPQTPSSPTLWPTHESSVASHRWNRIGPPRSSHLLTSFGPNLHSSHLT